MSARLLRILAELGHPVVARCPDLATSVKVIDLTVGGVRVTLTLTPTASSRAERSPDMQESARFLDLADQVLERFRPHVLLTYGGHPACLELLRGARMRSVAVVFHLHNSGYKDRRRSPTPRSRRNRSGCARSKTGVA
jgi:hypothetical protein